MLGGHPVGSFNNQTLQQCDLRVRWMAINTPRFLMRLYRRGTDLDPVVIDDTKGHFINCIVILKEEHVEPVVVCIAMTIEAM